MPLSVQEIRMGRDVVERRRKADEGAGLRLACG